MADQFDYVVVGAGSAGAVVASRLSEDLGVRVLLLEAGGDDAADEVRVPAMFPTLFKTRWDWNYSTTEQKQLDSRRAYWPRMKALGGCSSMNAMIYIRGNAADYDEWRDVHGATGWGYEDVLPYFIRAEGNTRLGHPYHGVDGPLHVEDRRWTHELSHAWVEAAVAAGLKRTDDFNGATQEGVGLYQVTCKGGLRWSVADAYLRPALGRPNLVVRTGARVSKVEFSGTRAVGLRYRHRGEERAVYADGEVVLSGGSINSPQLLMLSGVGPATHLREHAIDVVADVPGLGQNLHDHPATPLIWHTKNTTDIIDFANLNGLLRAKLRGSGALTSNVGEAGAFFRSRPDLDAPDLQVHMAPTGFYNNGLHEAQSRKVTVASTLIRVASRGTLRLRSANPDWHPAIDPAYFDDPVDLDTQVAGLRRILDISTHAPFAAYLAQPFLPEMPNPTDDDLRALVRAKTQTLYHPVGTCAMGSGDDSVVDPQLRVRGVEGLRVVDASVMPVVPRGNTNAPTIMIGERAADLLKERV